MTPYAQLLGAALADLPGPCRALHGGFGRFQGRITVLAAPLAPLRLLARLAGLPGAVTDAPLVFETAPEGGGARWTRRIGAHVMASHQTAMPDGTLAERLGPLTLAAWLRPGPQGLALETAWVRVLGLPLPRLLWPRVTAREWAEGGRYRFDISIALPLGGPRLIAYSGHLDTGPPGV
ncbi:DUF4166 domain-containing protein [Maliponia aquimaris]|uniref:DUF4166 domain-containing protein n=1 Tax=Maliponia aquimaris TaxID=1673631 RepID=A0A238KU05_9RHOB|nr:DUF4166 domain-containing protein [Maliponia aquimaris]SMX46178.1 hypothetical protein MAA8898_03350 [Maliponia aquimaris]